MTIINNSVSSEDEEINYINEKYGIDIKAAYQQFWVNDEDEIDNYINAQVETYKDEII